MKILTATHRGNRLLMEVIFLSFLALLITLITSCTGKQKNYSIIEFTGDGGVMNYSKSFYLY